MPSILFVNLKHMKEDAKKKYEVYFIRSYRCTCEIEASSKKEARQLFNDFEYDYDTEHESNNGEVIKKIELI